MSRKYYNSIDNLSIPTLYVGSAAPIDSKSVVTNLTDLTDSKLLSTTYIGMVVYVEEDFLISVFGKEYMEYKKKVNRYLGRKK